MISDLLALIRIGTVFLFRLITFFVFATFSTLIFSNNNEENVTS